jgi:hypothetical protein
VQNHVAGAATTWKQTHTPTARSRQPTLVPRQTTVFFRGGRRCGPPKSNLTGPRPLCGARASQDGSPWPGGAAWSGSLAWSAVGGGQGAAELCTAFCGVVRFGGGFGCVGKLRATRSVPVLGVQSVQSSCAAYLHCIKRVCFERVSLKAGHPGTRVAIHRSDLLRNGDSMSSPTEIVDENPRLWNIA